MLLFILLFEQIFAFVLFSSTKEAALPVTEADPIYTFHWNGSTPRIKDKDKILSGQFKDSSDEVMMEEIIRFSLNKWNQIPGSYLELALQVSPDLLHKDDGLSLIATSSSSNLTTAAHASPKVEGMDITECDITISSNSVSANSLTQTMIHELGHCLGLGHAHYNYGAIMGYSREGESLNLGADDQAGAIYLYPNSEYSGLSKDTLNCGSIASPANTSPWPLLFLPVLWVLLSATRRRRTVPAKPTQSTSNPRNS